MPQAFLVNFSPENGDLMYGLRDSRTEYLNAWEQYIMGDMDRLVRFKTLVQGNQKPNWNIIDNYNDYFFLGGAVDFGSKGSYSKAVGQMNARIHTVFKDTVDKNPGNNFPSKTSEQLLQRTSYAQDLQKSRFSPARVLEAPSDKVGSEGFTKNLSGSKKAAQEQNRSYLAIRRACKFGIAMVATSAAFVGCTIHFVLDGLDLKDVAQKNPRVGYGGRTAVSITTSELRYVYRNWNDLRNRLKFYVNLDEVAAPWVQDWSLIPIGQTLPNPLKAYRDEWLAYGQERVQSGKAAAGKSLY